MNPFKSQQFPNRTYHASYNILTIELYHIVPSHISNIFYVHSYLNRWYRVF